MSIVHWLFAVKPGSVIFGLSSKFSDCLICPDGASYETLITVNKTIFVCYESLHGKGNVIIIILLIIIIS